MSKTSVYLALALAVLVSCTNEVLLPSPHTQIPELAAEQRKTVWNPGAAPQNLAASHGRRRSIRLSWDAVPGGVLRYDVYRSLSPLGDYEHFAHSVENSITVETAPGAQFYFKINAVNANGEAGQSSAIVWGTSLALPQISDILEQADNGENSAVVYWYMDNAEDSSYKARACYRVSAFEAENPLEPAVEPVMVYGELNAIISGLRANTRYEFQVEAWLDEEGEAAREISRRMDAATARRTRPAAPLELSSLGGSQADRITLSWKLPEMVDVLDETSGEYLPHGLYFEIKRRLKGAASFPAGALEPGLYVTSLGLSAYVPGETVSWTDNSVVRGQEYEYQVKSYASDVGTRKISSAVSAAMVRGWAMARPVLSFGSLTYFLNREGTGYGAAELELEFNHDTRGLDYRYRLIEKVSPVGDSHPLDAGESEIVFSPRDLSLGELLAYKLRCDLTGKTSPSHRGRGCYSYALEVLLGDLPLETVYTLGTRLITENTESITVENFAVEDGYADRFILRWDREDNRQYTIKSAPAPEGPWGLVAQYPAGAGSVSGFTHQVTGQAGALTRYFSIQAGNTAGLPGEIYYSPAAQTLGKPHIRPGEILFYDHVEILFEPVQKADQFELFCQYEGGGSFSRSFDTSGLAVNDFGQWVYTLRPENCNQAAWAGKKMTLTLKAKNTVRASEISSDPLPGIRVFGPSGMTVQAARNESLDSIRLTWSAVEGAAGYYIIRRQLNPGASPAALGDIRYYVDAAAATVKGKEIAESSMGPVDSSDVSLPVPLAAGLEKLGASFVLNDSVLSDIQYEDNERAKSVGQPSLAARYAREQNEIAWGYPYRYLVIPVLDESHSLSVDVNNSAWTLDGKTLTGIQDFEKTGRTLGFVYDTAATKGTGHAEGSDTNDRISVTWTKPDDAPVSVLYNVYRRKQSGGVWDKLNGTAQAAERFDDTTAIAGMVYEYLVGLEYAGKGLSADPTKYSRFLSKNQAEVDTIPGQREARIAGFILPSPLMTGVSPQTFAGSDGSREYVSWNAAALDGVFNRGIAAYEVQVRNASIPGNAWQKIGGTVAADRNTFTNIERSDPRLLQVTRDYKHYYRVRSYTTDGDGTKYYSKAEPDSSLWATRKITGDEEFTAAAAIAITSALRGQSSDTNKNINFSGLSAGSLFSGITGSMDVCSDSNGFIGIGKSKNIFSYGAKVSGTYSSSWSKSKAVLTLTGAIPGLSAVVTIEDMRSGSGQGTTFQVNPNGTGDKQIDPKHYRPLFTFGTDTFGDVSGRTWDPSTGWQ
jgi:fibronectin type 3 domain-containing protein